MHILPRCCHDGAMAGRPTVHVRMAAGRVLVRTDPAVRGASVSSVRAKLATDARAISAASSTHVTQVNDTVSVEVPPVPGRGRTPQVVVEVVVPPGSAIDADVDEAELVCTGTIGALFARTTSGSVHAEEVAGPVDIRTGRGPVTLHRCAGAATISAADAGVIVRAAFAPLHIRGRAGDVHVWELSAPAQIATTTGNVRIGWAGRTPPRLDIGTSTGRVTIDVPDDRNASDVLAVRTITGDIRLTRS